MIKETDQLLAASIAVAIRALHKAVIKAKEAGLHVQIVASFNGLPITSRVSREYDFDVTEEKGN